MARLVRRKKAGAGPAQPVLPTLPATTAEVEALAAPELGELETQLKQPARVGIGAKGEQARKIALKPKIAAAKELEQRRRPLRFRGRRSTIRTRITPDIFASSLGAPKALLGT